MGLGNRGLKESEKLVTPVARCLPCLTKQVVGGRGGDKAPVNRDEALLLLLLFPRSQTYSIHLEPTANLLLVPHVIWILHLEQVFIFFIFTKIFFIAVQLQLSAFSPYPLPHPRQTHLPPPPPPSPLVLSLSPL